MVFSVDGFTSYGATAVRAERYFPDLYDLYDLHDLYDLYDLAHVAGWKP